MTPVLINGVDKQGVIKNGVQVKQALAAANETVSKGVYDATTLSAVDADLAVGNIINTATIFGKVGTAVPGGTETVEKYADATIATGISYTPAASGVFFSHGGATAFSVRYFSTVTGVWYYVGAIAYTLQGATAIGDGTNFKITNNSPGDAEYCLMRHYYSTGTYTREADQALAAGASWTPATSGFFASAPNNAAESLRIELQLTTAGWSIASETQLVVGYPVTIVIGNGTNLRVYNNEGLEYNFAAMRAKLT